MDRRDRTLADGKVLHWDVTMWALTRLDGVHLVYIPEVAGEALAREADARQMAELGITDQDIAETMPPVPG